MKIIHKNILLFTVAVFAVSCFIADAYCQKRERFVLEDNVKKNYAFQPGGRLFVENAHGRIRIEAWDKNEVEIDADEYRRGNYEVEIQIVAENDRIRIDTIQPRFTNDNWGRRKSRVHYTIKVPANTEITASTSHAQIEVEGIKNDVDVETSHGQIFIRDIEGEVQAKTSHASLELNNIKGDIYAKTSHSPLYIVNVDSKILDAETSHNNIRAEFNPDPNGRYELITSHGNIEVEVPKDSKMNVDAVAKPSRFHSDFDLGGGEDYRRSSRSRSRYYSRRDDSERRISGEVNGGGARIKLRTSHGSVYLYSK